MKVHPNEKLDAILPSNEIMIVNLIGKITGLRLERITLSRGSTTFEVDGMKDEEHCRYYLGTMFEVCFDSVDLFKRDIVDDESTVKLWSCLEAEIEEVILSEDGRVCELKLNNKKSIFIWSKEFDHDNLLVVRKYNSDEWFTIG